MANTDKNQKYPKESEEIEIIKTTRNELLNAKEANSPKDMKYNGYLTGFLTECYYFFANKLEFFLTGERSVREYTSKVDLDFYCQMPNWDIDTAVSLSLGQSPQKVKRYWRKFSSEFKQQYEQRKDLLNKAIYSHHIPYDYNQSLSFYLFVDSFYVIRPISFVKWAKQRNWELFLDMEDLVRKYALEDDLDLEGKYIELQREHLLLKKQLQIETKIDASPLGPRREESYQKLIAGLARLKFSNLESINASNITNQLAELDLPFSMISEDTIRTLLEPSRRMLGVKKPNPNTKK